MGLPAYVRQDDALSHFLRAHGVLRRLAAGRPFLARIGAPAMAKSVSGKVIFLSGYYQLAIRTGSNEGLEVGLLCSRRPDMKDASFMAGNARPLNSVADVQDVCTALDRLTARR
jgi:hypothetical protein